MIDQYSYAHNLVVKFKSEMNLGLNLPLNVTFTFEPYQFVDIWHVCLSLPGVQEATHTFTLLLIK